VPLAVSVQGGVLEETGEAKLYPGAGFSRPWESI
jgi:hypothetical protein